MAGASDKARFYLEQSVPELREWERREIFKKNEISSIAAKRSDFEHLLNSREARPADYARYAEYEINLDALRRKRVKRKGLKATTHSGQQHIFAILKRATTKFPGNIPLWMQYVEYARKQHANKKVVKILTDLLRLHPQKPDLWIYAARYVFDVQADMTAARSYMQRALRFCPDSSDLYLEYARLEMSHLAKIFARRKVLGMDQSYEPQTEELQHIENADADVILLTHPLPSAEEHQPSTAPKLDDLQGNSESLESTPAMNGAIPLAIFNAAMDRFADNAADIGPAFFDMFVEHIQLSCTSDILGTVVKRLIADSSSNIQGRSCQCRLPVVSISHQNPRFPAALRIALAEIKSAMNHAGSQKAQLSDAILTWLSPLASESDLLPELKRVLQATERQLTQSANPI